MVWAHIMSGAGPMADPQYYRKIWMAVIGYTDMTVEEVVAEHEAAQAEREREAKTKKPSTGGPRLGTAVQPKQTELDKMNDLLKFAKKAPPPVNLDAVIASE